MATLFDQYLADYNFENLPNCKQIPKYKINLWKIAKDF